MTDLSQDRSDVLAAMLADMSGTEREELDLSERIKARILRTKERDGQVDLAVRELRKDLLTRTDLSRPLGPGNRSETRALVLVGNPGAGKSSMLHRTISTMSAFRGYGVPGSGCPAVSVITPAPCNPKALGLELCRRLGYPMSVERSLPYVWATARDRIEFRKIALLHLDEIHSVLATANEKELTQLRMMLKTFLVSPDWPVVLLLSGLTEVVPFLEGPTELDKNGKPKPDTKGELRRRCLVVHLRSLSIPDDAPMLRSALADVAAVAGMTLAPDAEHTLVPRLAHAALYELGTAMQIAQEAIAFGLNAVPRCLTLGHEQFRLAYRLRTACGDEVNPFVARDWRRIDCTLVLKRNRDAADAAELERATR